MKSEIYSALHVINQAGEDIVKQVEFLRNEGVLTPHFAEICILAAQENCAEINVSAIHAIAESENKDASRLQIEREEKQRILASK